MSDGARAANDEVKRSAGESKWSLDTEAQWTLAEAICVRSGGNGSICVMQTAPTEAAALVAAELVLNRCDSRPDSECAEIVAYIKRRWGY